MYEKINFDIKMLSKLNYTILLLKYLQNPIPHFCRKLPLTKTTLCLNT